ncbi:zinc-ribbon domain-containing protein [Stenotrophomonas acidaminiphila]|uniref:zinc-ribbon domain-containing protein n=1 Tax=Stenotrophomonas acidaminiphila TaxID=128780 RepID=UPI003BEFBF30
MALIKCTECGRELSDKAAACPGCGAPIPQPSLVPQKPGSSIGASWLTVIALASAGVVLAVWCIRFWLDARAGT